MITPGNEGIVHHIILYLCQGELNDRDDGKAWDCINDIMPKAGRCQVATFVWAVGGNVRRLKISPVELPSSGTTSFWILEALKGVVSFVNVIAKEMKPMG